MDFFKVVETVQKLLSKEFEEFDAAIETHTRPYRCSFPMPLILHSLKFPIALPKEPESRLNKVLIFYIFVCFFSYSHAFSIYFKNRKLNLCCNHFSNWSNLFHLHLVWNSLSWMFVKIRIW